MNSSSVPASAPTALVPEGGDASRFTALYRNTLEALRRYLARMVGCAAEAEDLAHDAYARVFSAMNAGPVRAPRAFLYVTARRLALNRLHRLRISPLAPAGADDGPEPASALPSVERVVVAREEWAQIERALKTLPPECRTVLLLCKLDRLSHAEIAARLGLGVNVVGKRHIRALRLLRAALAGDNAGATAETEGARRARNAA